MPSHVNKGSISNRNITLRYIESLESRLKRQERLNTILVLVIVTMAGFHVGSLVGLI